MERYNIVIIGGGPGGYTAGIRAALKGAKVAVVEMEKLGGVCLNKGCIPSKALIASANEYQRMKHANEYGINLASPPVYDWLAMRQRKDKVVSTMVGGIPLLFKSHGVDHHVGFGKITGKNQVTVIAEDGKETKLETDNIIIATGSRAATIPIFKLDGKRVMNSDHLLELPHLPKSMLIIGGGVIGCEWASMLSLLDVEITVVEMMDHLLPLEDDGSAATYERELKKMKANIFTKTKVESLTPGPDGVQAKLSNGQVVNANQVLVAVGRAFNTEDLGLDEAGVKMNKNGSVPTGPDARTNIENIFAIGDVRGEILLAYTATHDGSVAVDNALGGKSKINYLGVPSVIFTHPEVASVGLTEKKALESHEVATGKFPLRALGKAHAENEIAGEIKVVADKKSDKILGVHAVGAHVTEVIHTAALAVHQGLTVEELGSLVMAHPVISEALMEATHDVHKMSVHLGKKK